MTSLKHKYFTMGAGTTYTHVGFWCPASKNTRQVFSDFAQTIENNKPKECQGVCDHCGTAIVNHHIIQDVNGEKFSVGSECIKKLNDVVLTETASQAEKEELDRIKKAERELMDELERNNNNGFTNKEMRSILKKENEKRWAEKRIEIAQPLISFISGVRLKSNKSTSLKSYDDSGFIHDFLQNPKKEPNAFLKDGILRIVNFKYGKSHHSRKDVPVEMKVSEFEKLYQEFENNVSIIDQQKIDTDKENNKKFK